MLQHRAPPPPPPSGGSRAARLPWGHITRAPSRTGFWSPAHVVLFDRLRESRFAKSASNIVPPLTVESYPHADWLGYPTSALDCKMAASVTSASRPYRPRCATWVVPAPLIWCLPETRSFECRYVADSLAPTME